MSDIQDRRPAGGRHRAARRPAAAAAQALAGRFGAPARRGVLALAASGAFLSTLATPAGAGTNTTENRVTALDLDALSAQAGQALRGAPVVTVSPGAKLAVEAASVTVAVTPAPEPEPEPVVAPTTSATAEAGTTAAPPTAVAVPPSAAGSAVVEVAMRYLGVPYLWGGTTPSGFDCSGFTRYVFQQVGISLPRTSSEQRYAGTEVPASAAQPGDLIWSPGHIGIYVGEGMQIEAPSPGKTVRYTPIWQTNATYIRLG